MARLIEDRGIVLLSPEEAGIASVHGPEAEVSGKKVILARQNLETVTKLTTHGIYLPGPIRKEFSWPGPFKPYQHQIVTADRLSATFGGYCFNDMGTGKTHSALWAIRYLRAKGLLRSVLVVSPLSTLTSVWAAAALEMGLSWQVVHGTAARRAKSLSMPAELYLLNPAGLRVLASIETVKKRTFVRLSEPLEKALEQIDLVLVDESSEFRNASADQYRVLQEILRARKPRVWLMSGAPAPRAPTDLWAQGRLATPRRVPRHFSHFRRQVMTKVRSHIWMPIEGWEDIAFEMLKPAIRYKLEDCIDLPPQIFETRDAPLSEQQSRLIKELRKELATQLKPGVTLTAANEGVLRQKFLQISAGGAYDELGRAHVIPAKARAKVLEELLAQAPGGKAIVYCPWRPALEMIYREISKRWKVALVHGGISSSKRPAIFDRFQTGDLEVLLAQPRTMAHGLTLTAAALAIWWSPTDNLDIYDQANRRIRRPGQSRTQIIVQISGTALERECYRRLDEQGNI